MSPTAQNRFSSCKLTEGHYYVRAIYTKAAGYGCRQITLILRRQIDNISIMAGSPTKAASPVKRSTSPKKRARKPAKPKAHPPTRDMVRTAIANMKDRKGSSLQAIKNYIAGNYRVDMVKMAPFIRRSIRAGVKSGAIKQTKGTGAAGRFRLGAAPKKVAKKRKAAKKAKKPKKKAKKVKKSKAKKATKKPKVKKAKKAAAKPKAEKKPKVKKAAKPKVAKPKKVKAKAVKKPAAKKARTQRKKSEPF